MKSFVRMVKEGASRADRTWMLYKGRALWFLDYNNQGLSGEVHVASSEEKVMKRFELGCNPNYTYDPFFNEEADANEDDVVFAWMEYEDIKAFVKKCKKENADKDGLS